MSDVMWIVMGMMVVTFIPRLIPFLLISGRDLPKRVTRFLEYVPYAALGALIIPGAISAIPENPLAGGIGILFAGLYSYIKGGMIVSVVGGILVTYLVLVL